jgi:hypothetical protein
MLVFYDPFGGFVSQGREASSFRLHRSIRAPVIHILKRWKKDFLDNRLRDETAPFDSVYLYTIGLLPQFLSSGSRYQQKELEIDGRC